MLYRYVTLSPQHRPFYITVVVCTLIALIAAIVIPFLSFTQAGVDIGLFDNTIQDVSDRTPHPINPSAWTFGIWVVIYLLQLTWVIYGVSLTCRRNRAGTGYMYYDPCFLTPSFYVIYIFNLALNIVWIFTSDQLYFVASLAALFGSAFCVNACLTIAARDLFRLENRISKRDMWFNVLVTHNALSFFASWLEVGTLLNLATVLKYIAELNDTAVGLIPLVVLAVAVLAWFPLDIFVFTQHARYLFAPYIVYTVGLSGIIDKNWDPEDVTGTLILAVVLLALTILFTIIKIFVTVYRATRKPLWFEL